MTTTDIIEQPNPVPAVQRPPRTSLIARMAERFGVEPNRMLDTLKATAFKSSTPVSNEQMMALLIVAEQHKLNPFTKEIFAFPDKGGIVPVVSVDGWARIINEHPMLDGIDFEWASDGTSCTCILYRKDRSHPIRITEFLVECRRNTEPWNKSPRRMLRHKALIQCARIAFGFAGIYDEDEAHRIINAGEAERVEPPSASADRVRAALSRSEPEVIEHEVLDDAPEAPPTPPAAAPAAPAKTYAKFVHEVLHATDADTAGLVLDEARGVLTQQHHAELVAAYRGKWQPPQE